MKSHRAHVAVAGFNGELYAVGGIGKRCFDMVLVNSGCYLLGKLIPVLDFLQVD